MGSIHSAASVGDVLAISVLLGDGEYVNALDEWGHTGLYKAAQFGHDEAVTTFLEYGADPNIPDPWHGETVLMSAVWSCRLSTVQLLIGRAAYVPALAHDGQTALTYAARKGDGATVDLLLNAGAEIRMYEAALLNRADVIEELCISGVDPNLRLRGNTPLVAAAEYGKLEAVTALRRFGAEIFDLRDAAVVGDPAVIRDMVRKGRDVDEADDSGVTGLMIAASRDDAEAVQAFLDCGADPQLATAEGYTALRWAQARQSVAAAALLARAGRNG